MILSQFITAYDYAGNKILGWPRLTQQEHQEINDASTKDLLWFFAHYGWLIGYLQYAKWIK